MPGFQEDDSSSTENRELSVINRLGEPICNFHFAFFNLQLPPQIPLLTPSPGLLDRGPQCRI